MFTRHLAAALLVATAGHAAAQAVSPIQPSGVRPAPQPAGEPRPEDGPSIQPKRDISITFKGGASTDGRADSDGAVGEVTTLRLPASLSIGVPIDQRNRLTFSINQESSFYDFENFNGFSGFSALDPLDYGLEAGIGVSYLHVIDRQWAVIGSVNAGFSGEIGADFQDGLTYSGLIAGRYQLSEDVAIGLGVSVRTRLEEDALIIPVPTLDIQASDYVSVHLGRVDAGPGSPDAGLKVDYIINDDLTVGGYVGVRFHQYRLRTGNSVIGSGILEDLLVPIGAFVHYDIDESTRFVANAVVMAHRELELQDANGVNLGDIEMFPSFGVGVGVEFDF